jgi:uncharacterized membrane protein
MDSDTLRPVIIAMTLYLAFSYIIPNVIKTPTNIKVVDDEIMYLMAQKGSLVSGVILVGIIVYVTNYLNQDAVAV